jgi:hypothetical protein
MLNRSEGASKRGFHGRKRKPAFVREQFNAIAAKAEEVGRMAVGMTFNTARRNSCWWR